MNPRRLTRRVGNGFEQIDVLGPTRGGRGTSPDGSAYAVHYGQATAAGAFRVGALVLAVIDVCLAAFTTVSLASGMSTVWTGMTLAIGGAVLAFAGRTGRATKIVCVVLATLAIVSAIYGNHQLDQKRLDISNILNGG
jgi:hypothetical protein